MKEHFFCSDTHWGHTAILRHMPLRGELFKTIDEMDTALIDAINKYVKSNDILWHLGDFVWQAGRAGHYRARLNVRELKICRGNHDSASLGKHVSSMDYMAFPKIGNLHFHLQHYPCFSWRKMSKKGIHLYGHSHGLAEAQLNKWNPGRRALDVGFDNALNLMGEFRPFHLDEILSHIGDTTGRLDR